MKSCWKNCKLALLFAAVLLSYLSATPLSAQSTGTPLVDVANIQIRHLFSEDGLPDLAVWEVMQDSTGFIWVGTLDGLARYDGLNFYTYRHEPDNPNSISGNSIRGLIEDRDGNLWIGTTGSGLNRFDPRTETFTRFAYDPADPTSLSHPYINVIYEDRAGIIWVGTYGGGLNRLDPNTDTITRYQHDPTDPTSLGHNDVFGIIEDRFGQLWVATYGGGLSVLDRESGTFTHYRHDPDDSGSLSSNNAYTFYEDRAGDLWVGTWGGLNLFDHESGTFTRYMADPDNPAALSNPNITDLLEDRAGNFWVGTWGGSLHRLDRDTGTFTRYPANEGGQPLKNELSESRIRSLIEDHEGLLWVGTESYGLNVADPYRKPFIYHLNDPDDPSSLYGSDTRALYKAKDGIIWIGTLSNGLYRYDMATEEVTRYRHDPDDPGSLANNTVFDIAEAGQGALWVGTANGASRLEVETGTFTSYRHDPDNPNSLAENHVTSLLVDADGLVWFATYGGISVLDPATNTFTHYRHDPTDPASLTSSVMVDIFQDHTGTIWASTEGNGLNRFVPETGTFVRYYHDPADITTPSDNTIVRMIEAEDGTLWLATWAGGLNSYDRETDRFRHYGLEAGIPDRLLCIVEDQQGRVWFNDGSLWGRFDPRSGTSVTYDYDDGLPTRGGTLNSCLVSDSGELIFGSANGLITFYPDQIVPSDFVPPVVFTDFRLEREPVEIGPDSVLEQAINFTDQIVLTRDARTLTFDFASLSYRNPKNNQYRYQMAGFDTQWYETSSDQRSVTYSNLPPGDYAFHVQGSNNDGIWNADGRSLAITILPAWWETPAFRLVLLVLLGVSALGAYYTRTAMYRRRTRELETQVAQRTREISTLLEASQVVGSTLDLMPLLGLIFEQLRKTVDYDGAAIIELRDGHMRVHAARGFCKIESRLPTSIALAEMPQLAAMVTAREVRYIPDIEARRPETIALGARLFNITPAELLTMIRSILCIPLVHKGEVIGALIVTHPEVGHYTARDQALAQAFANQIAYTLINANLHQQAQAAAARAERRRINRDLHDSLSQTIFAAQMALRGLLASVESNPEQAARHFQDLKNLINRAQHELRGLLSDTRPEQFSQFTLTQLIRWLGASIPEGRLQLDLQLDEVPVLPPDVQQAYYYIAQEAISNIIKHADAALVVVQLCIDDGALVLRIGDDGHGFQTGVEQPGHFGLTIMRERAESIGARFDLISETGVGTKLEIRWRIPDRERLAEEPAK